MSFLDILATPGGTRVQGSQLECHNGHFGHYGHFPSEIGLQPPLGGKVGTEEVGFADLAAKTDISIENHHVASCLLSRTARDARNGAFWHHSLAFLAPLAAPGCREANFTARMDILAILAISDT